MPERDPIGRCRFCGHQYYTVKLPVHESICIIRALNGKTPAEAAGITIEGENKWETVIRNAAVGHLPDKTNQEGRR